MVDLTDNNTHVSQKYLVDIDLSNNCLRNAVLNNVRIQSSAVDPSGLNVKKEDVGEIWFYSEKLYYGAKEGEPWVPIATGGDMDSMFQMLADAINNSDGTGSYISANYNPGTDKLTLTLNIASAGDIRNKAANKLASAVAVNEYAQHQISYGADTPSAAVEGDVVIVPDQLETRVEVLEGQILGGSASDGTSIIDKINQNAADISRLTGDISSAKGELEAKISSDVGALRAQHDEDVAHLNSMDGNFETRISGIERNYLNAVGGGLQVSPDNIHIVEHPVLGNRTANVSAGPTANATLAHSGSFAVPRITVDKYGHIQAVSEITLKLPASGDTDKKTSSANSTNKLFLVGATTQSSNGQTTYSNSSCYVSENSLYSNGSKVITESTYTTDINNIRDELAIVYHVKGSLTKAPLPGTTTSSGATAVAAKVGDVYNINIDTDGLDLDGKVYIGTTQYTVRNLFIDPPSARYLPNGTNIVYVGENKWDIMGGTSTSSYRNTFDGSGSTEYEFSHNLGVIPNVQVFDSLGDRVVTGVRVTTTKVTIYFNTAPTGKYTVVCTL